VNKIYPMAPQICTAIIVQLFVLGCVLCKLLRIGVLRHRTKLSDNKNQEESNLKAMRSFSENAPTDKRHSESRRVVYVLRSSHEN